MASLVKLSGAIISSVGAVIGVTVSSETSSGPSFSTNNQMHSVSQVSKNSEVQREVKKGYFVLADWGNETQWTVKSDKFVNLNEWEENKALGFNDVEMYLGTKKIAKGEKFTTQLNSKQYILYTVSGYKYKLENGEELIPGELRSKWNTLGAKKYEESPLRRWKKPWTVIDYDIEFDTCKFTKIKGDNLDNKGIGVKVICQVAPYEPRKQAWLELTEADYK